jgi:hypothetical protein
MTSGTLDVGPALDELRAAQREDDEAAQHPQLESYGNALAKICHDLGYPTVWPVGPAAERLAGAAMILSQGKVHARGWNTDMTAKRVLLVTVTAVTPLPLLTAAHHARSLGAAEVYSCGVRVQGFRPDEVPEILNAYIPLATKQAVGDPEA